MAVKVIPFVTAYGPKNKVVVDCKNDVDMTKQQFKDECDINRIMSKFVKTGSIAHFSQFGPQYGDVPAIDFTEAMNTVVKATEMFEALPSKIRARFDNEPENFLSFVQDENNLHEMREMGLAEPERRQTVPEPAPEPVPEPAPEG